jgi:hypothetical protein
VLNFSVQGQESPYNAKAYFEAEHNRTYLSLVKKVETSEALSREEFKFLEEYKSYLLNFYQNLSESEKDKYQKNKEKWARQPKKKFVERDTSNVDVTPVGENPARKFYLNNGLYGLGYGITSIFLFEIEDAGAVALPILSLSVSLAYPAINKKKYQGIDYSTIMLTRHGKFIGLLDGAALGFLLYGDISEDGKKGKAFAATMMATSIALGEVGFHVGKKKKFPEGKVATFKYYSLLIPFLTFSGLVVGNVEEPRVYGASVLAAGAASYWFAGKVYNKYKFTSGDILANSSFGLLSTGLGFGISPMEEPWHFIFPAITAIGGTYAGHRIFKNTKFSRKQGLNTNYAAMAGSTIGFLASLFIPSESHHVYLLLPVVTGTAVWAGFVSKYKKEQTWASRRNDKKWADMSFSFTPQNYFINKRLGKPGNGEGQKMGLPMFSLKLKL